MDEVDEDEDAGGEGVEDEEKGAWGQDGEEEQEEGLKCEGSRD